MVYLTWLLSILNFTFQLIVGVICLSVGLMFIVGWVLITFFTKWEIARVSKILDGILYKIAMDEKDSSVIFVIVMLFVAVTGWIAIILLELTIPVTFTLIVGFQTVFCLMVWLVSESFLLISNLLLLIPYGLWYFSWCIFESGKYTINAICVFTVKRTVITGRDKNNKIELNCLKLSSASDYMFKFNQIKLI